MWKATPTVSTRIRPISVGSDATFVERSLSRLQTAAQGTENLMPAMLEAVKAYATVGEICSCLTHVFGRYTDPSISVVSSRQSSGLQRAQGVNDGPSIPLLVSKPGLDGSRPRRQNDGLLPA